MTDRWHWERSTLLELESALCAVGRDLAVFLVYDRPERVEDRPGIARAFFAQRCVSDAQLDQTVSALRAAGVYVELFDGELPLLEALASGRIDRIDRSVKLVYNGIEGGIAHDGFQPGRKALIPAVADSYGLICSNSNAYACALGRHKFHYFTVLDALGVRTPPAWHYRLRRGWAGDRQPEMGMRVIAKSTYESWAVGVTNESVFTVDTRCEERVEALATEIGQSVCVQQFLPGEEVCVPVLSVPDRITTPPVEVILAKAPGDPNAVMTIEDNLRLGAVAYRAYQASADVLCRIREAAVAAFEALELAAFARIDFRVDAHGTAWVIDVGVSPGLSRGSSAFASIAELGFDHGQYLRIAIAATLADQGLLPSSRARTRSPAF